MPKTKPPPEYLQIVSANLRRLRAREGISQADVADVTGAHVPTVSRWENALSEPGRRYLNLLAEAFGQAGPDEFYAAAGLPEPSRPKKFRAREKAIFPPGWEVFLQDGAPQLAFNKQIDLRPEELAQIQKVLLTAEKRKHLARATKDVTKGKKI